MPINPHLVLKRRLNASPDKVYAAWTEPAHLARWWGPSGADRTVKAEMDVRVGGRFQIVFEAEDGEQHDVRGVYKEVEAQKKLVFSWAWRTTPERESLVTVDLEPDGEATLLTLTHEKFFDEAARDRHRQGWSGALDKLAALFE
jgi:uncharacterized protein YndB with AHSA1/START domain